MKIQEDLKNSIKAKLLFAQKTIKAKNDRKKIEKLYAQAGNEN